MEARDILNPEALTLFFYVIVPGFIAIQVYDAIVPSERRNFGEALIQLVSYSLITSTLFFWAYPLLNILDDVRFRSTWPFGLPLYLLGNATFIALDIFVAPSFLALLVYRLRTKPPKLLKALMNLLYFQVDVVPMDPMPTAWDKFFSKRQSCFMIFHMKNGETIGGAFGPNSYASGYPAEQQLYTECLYAVDQNTKAFSQMHGSIGAIIRFEDCDYIDMIKP